MIVAERTAYDCQPTLSDSQVAAFCRDGCMVFDGVVPEPINQRCFDWLDAQEKAGREQKLTPSAKSTATGNVGLLREAWFVDNVLLCPVVVGAVRALLGPGFGLPIMLANHRATTPSPAQGWHHDGDSHYGPEVEVLQVRYFRWR